MYSRWEAHFCVSVCRTCLPCKSVTKRKMNVFFFCGLLLMSLECTSLTHPVSHWLTHSSLSKSRCFDKLTHISKLGLCSEAKPAKQPSHLCQLSSSELNFFARGCCLIIRHMVWKLCLMKEVWVCLCCCYYWLRSQLFYHHWRWPPRVGGYV